MRLSVWAPMWVEVLALRRALPHDAVVHAGYGPRRAARTAARRPAPTGRAVVVAGLAGALQPGIATGSVVVASVVRAEDPPTPCPAVPELVAALRHRGLAVHIGPIGSVRRLAPGPARGRLAEAGALAVDMESAWLLRLLAPALSAGRPFAVVRVVADTPRYPLAHPATLWTGPRALRALVLVGHALRDWTSATDVALHPTQEVMP